MVPPEKDGMDVCNRATGDGQKIVAIVDSSTHTV